MYIGCSYRRLTVSEARSHVDGLTMALSLDALLPTAGWQSSLLCAKLRGLTTTSAVREDCASVNLMQGGVKLLKRNLNLSPDDRQRIGEIHSELASLGVILNGEGAKGTDSLVITYLIRAFDGSIPSWLAAKCRPHWERGSRTSSMELEEMQAGTEASQLATEAAAPLASLDAIREAEMQIAVHHRRAEAQWQMEKAELSYSIRCALFIISV